MVAAKTDKITGHSMDTGRRKSAVARVRVKSGSGVVTVNGRPLNEYFVNLGDQRQILDCLEACGKQESVDVQVICTGGGPSGQAGAAKMGLSRALVGMSEENFAPLRDGHFLTRDSRMKERKKYGLRGARRGVQFSKR